MTVWEWVGALAIWNIGGVFLCLLWIDNKYADGWELCNPYYAYQYHKSVNWFGAIMLSLVYTVLCPVGAVCYWVYKLCTVGRR
jgi:hypothetical protein